MTGTRDVVPPQDVVALLRLAASSEPGAFSWLDGGREGRGFVGVEADVEIEADSFEALDAIDAAWRGDPGRIWIGWLTYDLGADVLLQRVPERRRLPGLSARRFAAAWSWGSDGERIAHGSPRAIERLAARVFANAESARGVDAPWPFGELRPHDDAATYRGRVAKAIEHIRAGDTYQVNLSQVITASLDCGCPPAEAATRAFARLRAQTPASMGALIRVRDGHWIVSNSPETLFDLRSDSRRIASWPIKGTRPRFEDPAQDRKSSSALMRSEKDAAEHVMIVDLVRNDLGRIAEPGSVAVSGPPQLVSLPTVHHLVSEVHATLPSTWTLRACFDALFPGGSITGAPKRRTVEIIDALEGAPRSIYCGAIFVLEPAGCRVSIPIRTAVVSHEGLWMRSGGGVVVDSDPEDERLETWAKAKAFARRPDKAL